MYTIKVHVNDSTVDLPVKSTINDMLRHLQIAPKGIAIAVNTPAPGAETAVSREIVSRQQWSRYTLSDQQNITIIKATQGG